MTTITTDRRTLLADFDPEGERLAEQEAATYRDARLRLARTLAGLELRASFRYRGYATVLDFAVSLGIARDDARGLVALGRALDLPVPSAAATPPDPEDQGDSGSADSDGAGDPPAADPAVPTVEERIRSGHLPIQNATTLGRLVGRLRELRPGEDWTAAAESSTGWRFLQAVRRRIEEEAQGTRELFPFSTFVTHRTLENLARARVLASDVVGRPLEDGQMLALLTNHFLDDRDPMRRGEKPRRVGPTEALPDSRYVPRAVAREVWERAGARCEVGGCTTRHGLGLAHLDPHARGGSREADNMFLSCRAHHVLFDADVILFAGWQNGRPRFRNQRGELLEDRPRPVEVPVAAQEELGAEGGRDPALREPKEGFSDLGVPLPDFDPAEDTPGDGLDSALPDLPPASDDAGARPPIPEVEPGPEWGSDGESEASDDGGHVREGPEPAWRAARAEGEAQVGRPSSRHDPPRRGAP